MMRYELGDYEWRVISPMLPNEPRLLRTAPAHPAVVVWRVLLSVISESRNRCRGFRARQRSRFPKALAGFDLSPPHIGTPYVLYVLSRPQTPPRTGRPT